MAHNRHGSRLPSGQWVRDAHFTLLYLRFAVALTWCAAATAAGAAAAAYTCWLNPWQAAAAVWCGCALSLMLPHAWQTLPAIGASAASAGLRLLLLPTDAADTCGHRTGLAATATLALPLAGFLFSFLCLFVFPVLSFSGPTGPYRTLGTVHDVWTHEAVVHVEASGVGVELTPDGPVPHTPGTPGRPRMQRRRVHVQIYYPSSLHPSPPSQHAKLWSSGGHTAHHEQHTVLRQFARHLLEVPHWAAEFVLSHFKHMPSPFVHGAPLSSDSSTWPVVLYSHGLFGWKSFNTPIAAELASHGYVVVGMEHPGDSIVAVPGGRVSASQLFSLFIDTENDGYKFSTYPLDHQWKTYNANLLLRHQDMMHVARTVMALGEYGRVQPGQAGWERQASLASAISPAVLHRLSGRVDGTRLATFGHSYGGGTGYMATCTHGAEGAGGQRAGAREAVSGQRAGSRTGERSLSTSPTAAPTPSLPEPVIACSVGLDAWYWPVSPHCLAGRNLYGGIDSFCNTKECGAAAEAMTDEAVVAAAAAANAAHKCSPILLLTSELWHWRRWNLPLWRVAAARHRHSHVLTFKDTSHFNFTDGVLMANPWILRLSPDNGIGRADPLRSVWLQARLATLFIQAHLPSPVALAGAGAEGAQDAAVAVIGGGSSSSCARSSVLPCFDACDPFLSALCSAHDSDIIRQEMAGMGVQETRVPRAAVTPAAGLGLDTPAAGAGTAAGSCTAEGQPRAQLEGRMAHWLSSPTHAEAGTVRERCVRSCVRQRAGSAAKGREEAPCPAAARRGQG